MAAVFLNSLQLKSLNPISQLKKKKKAQVLVCTFLGLLLKIILEAKSIQKTQNQAHNVPLNLKNKHLCNNLLL